ncbi:MAG: autoinducer synthase [Novosphingobium sp.]|nr:autoinducer synthase [Novosphingobium sp.]
MLHVIDHANAPDHRLLLETMFADRKLLFVDLFGWDIPVVDGTYEIDQFDGSHAIYLVVEDQGEHEASLRLLPTDRPHMLDTLFSHLCPFGMPKGRSIWESTRLCLPQRHGAGRRRELRNILISAMVDVALERGIVSYTGVLPAAFRTEVLSLGWRGEPLGPVVPMQGGAVGAFRVHVDADTPERLGWSGTYVHTVAEEVPA